MLIYDHNKEFIGIDQESLKVLGYDRFEGLIHEHKDVAELFVKKPGYIHNFTNFPWIDFVLHAESDDAKVIIAGKTKAISATIEVNTLHLKHAPQEEAFLVTLKNIQDYHLDASERPEPTPVPFEPSATEFNAPDKTKAEPLELASEPTPEPELEIEPFISPVASPEPLTIDEDLFVDTTPAVQPTPTPVEEELDIFFHEDEIEDEPRIEVAPEIPVEEESIFDNLPEEENATPMLGANLSEEDKAYLADLEFSEDYVYNPQIAADELGLPVELIEEFIGDFIKQAHEFKEQLFNAIDSQDFDNIKILSHKLKGVAANLRIEDSFEVLRNVNETNDIKECEANLKRFYITIAKLEGKDIEEAKRELEKPEEELYDLTPKNTPQEMIEEDIIQPLDLPDFEEESFAAPESFDNLSDASKPEPTSNDDEIYDFGLVTEEGSQPLMVVDDEEEIMADLENFDTIEEPELISDIQDFDEEESAHSDSLPILAYDITVAAAEIGLSPDLVSALIEDYIVEANEMRNKLNEVIADEDMMRWKGYAVQLKGVSDNLRIKEISDALQNLITSGDTKQAKAATQEFYGFINQL